MTSHRVAPTPNPASRMLFGTARSASLEVMMTMGRTTTERVSPPDMTVSPPVSGFRNSAKMIRPRMPYTMDGTPARFRTFVTRMRLILVSVAYSSRYTAAPMPRGTAKMSTMTSSSSEPMIPCFTPARKGNVEFVDVRKLVPRSASTGIPRTATLPRSTTRTPSAIISVINSRI